MATILSRGTQLARPFGRKVPLYPSRVVGALGLGLGLATIFLAQSAIGTDPPGGGAILLYGIGLALLLGLGWLAARGPRAQVEPRVDARADVGAIRTSQATFGAAAEPVALDRDTSAQTIAELDGLTASAVDETPEPKAPRPSRRVRNMLGAILVVAACLRLVGLNWDNGQRLHPDERFITMVATKIELPGALGYFDTAQSTLNPYNNDFGSYIYGTAPLFFTRALGDAIQGVMRAIPGDGGLFEDALHHLRNLTSYGDITLLGRV